MASSINATTSSGIVATADNTGSLALQANGTTVMTVTSTGVTTQVGAPAFSAYMSASTQSGSSGVWTKIQFNTEVFDTNSNYDTGTYRFTPTVAGYYQVNVNGYFNASTSLASYVGLSFYKNGSIYAGNGLSNNGVAQLQLSQVIYCNGSTDYIEAYFQTQGGSGAFIGGGATVSMFSAAMIRSA